MRGGYFSKSSFLGAHFINLNFIAFSFHCKFYLALLISIGHIKAELDNRSTVYFLANL